MQTKRRQKKKEEAVTKKENIIKTNTHFIIKMKKRKKKKRCGGKTLMTITYYIRVNFHYTDKMLHLSSFEARLLFMGHQHSYHCVAPTFPYRVLSQTQGGSI